ncbi:MAG: FadR/GntR family transcriptional regulator [Aurantimicrobium sp.]|uniref:FadR/GntR family transcriptional regulator n=1 Tax=Aurantimicrobium sp. TaxID=1930784 RepID=UPI002FCBE1F4
MAITDEVILQIKNMIVSGRLKPGDRLLPEKELSEELGVSRNSLREAIKALVVFRVLDVRQGDGTYVTSLEPDILLEAVSFVVDLHDDASILDLFAVRRILEPAAAAQAALQISSDEITELHTLMHQIDESSSIEQLVEHDLAFHHQIVAAAGNGYLTSLLDSLSSSTVRARVWRGLTQDKAIERTLSEHKAILAAIEAKDTELAKALTTVHVSGVEQWLRLALDSSK